jgi:type I restriction enzyme M protein
LDSFVEALQPVGMLDRFQVAGVAASWWGAIQYDLKTLAAQGFYGLVDSWIASLRAALEDRETRGSDDPLEHPLVQRLLPGYLDRLEAVEAEVADLKAQIAEAKRAPEENEEEVEEVLSPEEIRDLKRDLTAKRKALKTLQGKFLGRLEATRLALEPDDAQTLVLVIERERLTEELTGYAMALHEKAVASAQEDWDKYRIPLQQIEADREAAMAGLNKLARELGYAG